ncbi:hypothetical protein FACS189431_3380 [Alphaproteobacteria bacterium]|nr:hypothetical protein FACS189431_3380 [Alphaproteobacteria bacterium]
MAEPKFDSKEIEAGKGMAILSYIIALIPYFAEKNNKFARYHAVQGMNILIVAAGYGIIVTILTSILSGIALSTYNLGMLGFVGVLSLILSLGYALIGILDLIGLIYAATGKAQEVPILGKIKIIKK